MVILILIWIVEFTFFSPLGEESVALYLLMKIDELAMVIFDDFIIEYAIGYVNEGRDIGDQRKERRTDLC